MGSAEQCLCGCAVALWTLAGPVLATPLPNSDESVHQSRAHKYRLTETESR